MHKKRGSVTLHVLRSSINDADSDDEGPSLIDGRNLLKEIEQQCVDPDQHGLNRTASFNRKRDKFERLSTMSMDNQDSSHVEGSTSYSSSGSVPDIEIKPHQSKASQNLSDNASLPSDQELSATLHVQRTTSDTFVHSESAKDLREPSQEQALTSKSQSSARNSSSFSQMDSPTERESVHSSELIASPKTSHHDPARGQSHWRIASPDPDGSSASAARLHSPSPTSTLLARESSISPASHSRSRSPQGSRSAMYHIHVPQDYRPTALNSSMPLPHTESQSVDQMSSAMVTPTHRTSRGPFTEQRAFLIEKELLESQLRKLQVENATLLTENKLIKEKYNRAQARIQQLESHLGGLQQESAHMQEELSQEVSSVRRQTKQHEQRERQELEDRVLTLTRQMETLKSQNLDLEKKLETLKLSSELAQKVSDRSLVVESYKSQTTVLVEELHRLKQVMSDTENARGDEVAKRREAAAQVVRLTELKATLQQELENMGGGTVAEKQTLRDEHAQYEDRIQQIKNLHEDAVKNKDEHESTSSKQVHDLVKEKHNLQAQVRNFQDKMDAVAAENDSLCTSLRSSAGVATSHKGRPNTWEAQVVSLQSDLDVSHGDLDRQKRTSQRLEAELDSARGQLRAKQMGMEQMVTELDIQSRVCAAPSDESLDGGHAATMGKLSAELDQLQAQLRQKTRLLGEMNNSESDRTVEVNALRENLSALNHELSQKEVELKRSCLELTHQRHRANKLDQDITHRDVLLSQNIGLLLSEGKLQSPLYEKSQGETLATEVLTHAEAQSRMLAYEKEKLEHDFQKLQANIDTLVKENTELTGRFRELHQDLVQERAQVCQTTADRMDAEQKLHVCEEERDSLRKECQQLKTDLDHHDTRTADLIHQLKMDTEKNNVDYEEMYHNMDRQGKKKKVPTATLR